MTHTTHADKSMVHAALDEIIRAHGLLAVARALVARSFRRELSTRHYPLLSNHLRRDIGLPPVIVDDQWLMPRR